MKSETPPTDKVKKAAPAALTAADRLPADHTPLPISEEETRKHVKRIVVLACILILLLAVLAGVWWWKGSRTAPAPGKADTASSAAGEGDEEAACADGLFAYENATLGIGFCYPEAWGAVGVVDAKFETADTGSRKRIQFSDKAAVNVGLVSEDWTTVVPRDGTCVDPASQVIPAYDAFAPAWVTEGAPTSSASRSLAVSEDEHLIFETVDNLLTNGVCITGYKVIDSVYPHATASYSAEFNAAIDTPDEHVAAPDTLVPAGDRDDFIEFVQSIHKV